MRCHLVIGASGQVGIELVRQLRGRAIHVVGASYSRPSDIRLDLADPAGIRETLDALNPAVVWLAGAYTHVDGCEDHPLRSEAVNVRGPETVARWAQRRSTRVVFFSSDYVFDGAAGPYRETDLTHPLCVYGRHKQWAETALLTLLPERALVVRTSWVYSWESEPRNFMQRLVWSLRRGEPVTVPADQEGSPTYAPDLAACTIELLQHEVSGLIHVAGPETVSRLTFALAIARAFRLSPRLLTATDTRSLSQRAPRPLKGGLISDRLAGYPVVPPRAPAPVLAELATRYAPRR